MTGADEPVPAGRDAWRAPPRVMGRSSAARRRNMQAIRSREKKPEWVIRRLVRAQGLRYRVAAPPLPSLRRTADLVFRPAKVAVFIDGCYWHGCPQNHVPPKTNPGYWSDKVARDIGQAAKTPTSSSSRQGGQYSDSGSMNHPTTACSVSLLIKELWAWGRMMATECARRAARCPLLYLCGACRRRSHALL